MKSNENIELYVIFFEGTTGLSVDVFYDKPALIQHLRSKVYSGEWEQIVLPCLIKDLDKGKVVSVNWMVANKRIYVKSITCKPGLRLLKESIIENFVKDYYKDKHTQT